MLFPRYWGVVLPNNLILIMSSRPIPQLPFPNFKWKWACLQCTEGINDPLVLLGVLFRMAKLENGRIKYSSEEFASELRDLSADLQGSGVNVDLARRTGPRNLIRNSGQYWKALNLIPQDSHGVIKLTDFGRMVADHTISQTEFSAITIMTFRLPNSAIQTNEECQLWERNGLSIYPLQLILKISRALRDNNTALIGVQMRDSAYITVEELTRIIIPLSGNKATIQDYVSAIRDYRGGRLSLSGWPNCCPEANDLRIAREYLLFLSNYGYMIKQDGATREAEQYYYNFSLDQEILSILQNTSPVSTYISSLEALRATDVISDVERKRVNSQYRPNQAKFRKDVLAACKRCIITNVDMPEVLEAAHIKPHKYNGEEIAPNGIALRMDIHLLFDAGHIRISEDGIIDVSPRARMNYGSVIPPAIHIPEYVNKDFLRWRWLNYNGV